MDQSDKRAQGVQQKMTLDQAVILGEVQEFKKALEELKRTLEQVGERLTKVETDGSVTEPGLHLICAALEGAGLMKKGEPVPKTTAKKESMVAGKEENFTILKFEEQQGAKIGSYAVAYRNNNLEEKWIQAFNILRSNNSTIKDRYLGPGYQFSYWLYGQNKIYRQKLKPKTQET